MFASSIWVAAVIAAVTAFAGWLLGLAALLIAVHLNPKRHPRLAAILDRSVGIAWIVSTVVLFGPALALTLVALLGWRVMRENIDGTLLLLFALLAVAMLVRLG